MVMVYSPSKSSIESDEVKLIITALFFFFFPSTILNYKGENGRQRTNKISRFSEAETILSTQSYTERLINRVRKQN